MTDSNVIYGVDFKGDKPMSAELLEMAKRIASKPSGPDMSHKSTADFVNGEGYWANPDTSPSEYVAPDGDCA